MKWIKKGLIYNLKGEKDWCITHAAVPFAEHIVDDQFRIYFSTRDANNRSHTSFIEVDINEPKNILKISDQPVLNPGELGTFDDSGAMGSCLVKMGEKKFLYYIGWNRRITIPYHNSIGLAIAENTEEKFSRVSQGPIIDRNTLEPYFTASNFVLVESGKWRMWYLSCFKWDTFQGKPNPYYHIKYAESDNGINWKRNGVICIDLKDKKEWAIARPCVIKEKNHYKMWYCYRGEKPYKIGYAESKDGITWERLDEQCGIEASDSGWDSEMIAYPFVFNHKDTTYMLYNGNQFGKTGFGYAILEN